MSILLSGCKRQIQSICLGFVLRGITILSRIVCSQKYENFIDNGKLDFNRATLKRQIDFLAIPHRYHVWID